ncbi:MAG: hypothetical protein M0Z58_01845, partial [Nitrospiraceae bacterium]|nr:hypothetical protein [Nitrospiraceae bacterium]
MKPVSFRLLPVPPFRLDYTAWALRRRPDNLIDRWEEGQYGRVFNIDGSACYVSVLQSGGPEAPELEVSVRSGRVSAPVLKRMKMLLTRMLGLDVEVSGFYALAR